MNRHHQVANQGGGCLKSGVDYTLLPLGSRRMIHCVLVIFPGKRTFWTSGQGHYRRNAAHLRSTLTTDNTRRASPLCLSRFITNCSCTFVTQETEEVFLKPTTHSPKSSCVITLERHALYTCSHVHIHNCALQILHFAPILSQRLDKLLQNKL